MTSSPRPVRGDVDGGVPLRPVSPRATSVAPCPPPSDTDTATDTEVGNPTDGHDGSATRSRTTRGTRSETRAATVTAGAVELNSSRAADDGFPALNPGAARVLLRILRKEHDRQLATQSGRSVADEQAVA